VKNLIKKNWLRKLNQDTHLLRLKKKITENLHSRLQTLDINPDRETQAFYEIKYFFKCIYVLKLSVFLKVTFSHQLLMKTLILRR
jgi:hypothetical protein